ncbi:MAG: D-alanyl-D-alanine carboxypeptidase family protein [Gammaproteobacteria bacterium]|jgi:D-alanyl-D-alanine carboxypeptidase (penicillin-binding protein 5/6)
MNMYNILFLLVIVTCTSLFTGTARTAELPIPKAPSSGAKAFVIQDFNSGRIIAEENADTPVEPASITKMMTAHIVFNELASGNLALDDMVTISEKAWRTPGSRMFVEVGKQVSVEDLLLGLIIQSGNDATVALAEHIAGSEETFAALMNRHAEEIGLTGSHFVNSTGLPDEQHYMTARDIARLAALTIEQYPEYYKWYSQKEFTFNDITQYNRNKLLWQDDSVDGIKTGHTESAGYCLATSAVKDGMRLITVVLGTSSENARIDASQALLNYGFRFFETHKLYDAGTPLTTTRIWKGATDSATLGLDKPLYVTIPRGQYKSLDASMSINNRIIAPVAAGQDLGVVQVKLGEEIVAEQPLVSLNSVAEGSFMQRITDEALLYFE